MAWFRVLIGWRARGGVASHSRRTPSENEICEVIWGSISCFHQCGGPHFKCFCVFFLFPLGGCEMNAAERGVKHIIFSIFSSLLAAGRRNLRFSARRNQREKQRQFALLCPQQLHLSFNGWLFCSWCRGKVATPFIIQLLYRAPENSMALCWQPPAKQLGLSFLLKLKLGRTFQIAMGQKQGGWGGTRGWGLSPALGELPAQIEGLTY